MRCRGPVEVVVSIHICGHVSCVYITACLSAAAASGGAAAGGDGEGLVVSIHTCGNALCRHRCLPACLLACLPVGGGGRRRSGGGVRPVPCAYRQGRGEGGA